MKSNNLYSTLAVLSVFLMYAVVSGCSVDDNQNLPERNWQLTWSDDFEGPAGQSPNLNNWTFDIGTGDNGWGNEELQYYTNRPENVSLNGNGQLAITALRESFGGMPFTSARIKTEGLFEQAYGRFEASIKNPYGPGIWPAFWMLGADFSTVGWPQSGEIDIMEMRGQQPHIAIGSLHGPGYSAGNALSSNYSIPNNRFDDDFYLYAIEWFPDRIDFFVDDFLYNRIKRSDVPGEWVFDKPFFMILNVAVGGTFVGFPTDQTPFPQQMLVDYVRVYELAD
ncbi:MAG: glycoside hydrolase family 16 protein [Balneolaceae bacterium]|nr:MAG: glycoside hydrolase family 16 protein [Balneolaceae bacterium]